MSLNLMLCLIFSWALLDPTGLFNTYSVLHIGAWHQTIGCTKKFIFGHEVDSLLCPQYSSQHTGQSRIEGHQCMDFVLCSFSHALLPEKWMVKVTLNTIYPI